jgi:hypothetical protein
MLQLAKSCGSLQVVGLTVMYFISAVVIGVGMFGATTARGESPSSPIPRGFNKFDPIVGGKKERAAFDAFYSSRDYAPLWISDGKPNARARTAIAYLARVEADGLEPADYPVPDFSTLIDPGALAEAEIRLTMSVVTYARHAQFGTYRLQS